MPRLVSRRAFLVLGGAALGIIAGSAEITGVSRQLRPEEQRISLGEMTLVVQADPWRMSLRAPSGDVVWDEAADDTLNYQTLDGHTRRARRLLSVANVGEGSVQLVAETDEPAAGAIVVEVRAFGPRTFSLRVTPNSTSEVVSVGGAFISPPDERFVGF